MSTDRIPQHLQEFDTEQERRLHDKEMTDAESVRLDFLDGFSIEELSKGYDRTRRTIRDILAYRRFPEVRKDLQDKVLARYENERQGRKLNQEEANKIRYRYRNGWETIRSLAEEYGVGSTTIWRIVHNKIYKED